MKKEVTKENAPNPIPKVVMPEKGTQEEHKITGVVLTELETLKLQNLAKDILIYQLQAQQVLGQKQVELQKQIEGLRQKYNLDSNWEIATEGTKFIKSSKMSQQ